MTRGYEATSFYHMELYIVAVGLSSLFFGIIWKTDTLMNVFIKMFYVVLFIASVAMLLKK